MLSRLIKSIKRELEPLVRTQLLITKARDNIAPPAEETPVISDGINRALQCVACTLSNEPINENEYFITIAGNPYKLPSSYEHSEQLAKLWWFRRHF